MRTWRRRCSRRSCKSTVCTAQSFCRRWKIRSRTGKWSGQPVSHNSSWSGQPVSHNLSCDCFVTWGLCHVHDGGREGQRFLSKDYLRFQWWEMAGGVGAGATVFWEATCSKPTFANPRILCPSYHCWLNLSAAKFKVDFHYSSIVSYIWPVFNMSRWLELCDFFLFIW